MNDVQERHTAKVLIGLLILINVVTLAMLWFLLLRRPPLGPPPPDEGRGREVQSFLKRELNLTEDQARKFEELRDRFISSLPSLPDEIQRLRETMMNELFVAQPDEKKVEALTGEIGIREAAMEKGLYDHFRDLVAVCRPDQKRKFQAIMNDVLEMIGPPGPPPPARGKRPPEGRAGAPQERHR
jgi:Spy/CpxP family protein refolding chaperone